MKELIISQIAPIAATAITAILCIVIRQVGKAGIDLLVTKKKETDQKIEVNGYKSNVDKAFEVWKIVDDKFRLTQNAMEIFGSKEKLFEQILLQRIPGLTQKNIDDFRDTVSGEVNKGREALIVNTNAQQIADLQQANAALQSENQSLKSTITQISSAIQPVAIDKSTTQNIENASVQA